MEAIQAMPRILVTGAGGLVGNRLVKALSSRHDVFGLVRAQPASPIANVEWIVADLSNPAFTQQLPEGVETVVHLAQSSRFREFPAHAIDIFSVNVASTALLLDWSCRNGVQRFVLASSGSVYGSGAGRFVEDDRTCNDSPLGMYPASKRCAELLSRSYSDRMLVTALRFFFVYGREQRSDMLIPRLADSVARGRPIKLQGRDGLRINPIHVDDAVSAIVGTFSLSEGHTINIAGPEVLSLRRIVDALGSLLGCTPIYDVDETVRPNDLIGDTMRMTSLVGPPHVRFVDGVAEVCAAHGG